MVRENLISFKTVLTILGNIQAHPEEEKYYSLKKGNKLIESRLLNCPSAIELLLLVNFIDYGETFRLAFPPSPEEQDRLYAFVLSGLFLNFRVKIVAFTHATLEKRIEVVETSQIVDPGGSLVC